ncbi:MAG: hypothetical protein JSR44_16540 [Spirochaetes bacterium]|nr:hypothetical protein [Spirochaetota bacterium]
MEKIVKANFKLLIVLVVLSAACTGAFRKVAYNSLVPVYIVNRVNHYFDLNRDQENFLRARIALHHAWHRRTQLPLYATDLAELKKRFERRLVAKDLDWMLARLTAHRDRIYRRVIPDINLLLRSLSVEQIERLRTRLADENAELEEKLNLPLAKRHEDEFEKSLKQIEDWTGALSREQRAALRQRFETFPDAAGDWLAYRRGQQEVFVKLLLSKPDAATLAKDLTARTIGQEKNVPKKFRSGFQRTLLILKDLILAADALLTPEQRTHVSAKAAEYIELLNEISH